MSSFPEEKTFRVASMCAEQWFSTIGLIWKSIPVDGQSWDVPALLLHRLFTEFKEHSPTLEGNRVSFTAAARNGGFYVLKFRGAQDACWSAHVSVLEGTGRFLRDITSSYQARFQLKNPNWWQSPSESILSEHAAEIKRVLDRWVFDWEQVPNGCPELSELIRIERGSWKPAEVAPLQTTADIVDSDYFEPYSKTELSIFFGCHRDTVGDWIRNGTISVHPADGPDRKPNAEKVRVLGDCFLRLCEKEHGRDVQNRFSREKLLADLLKVGRKSAASR